MGGRHAEPVDRVTFEVDFDQNDRLLADNPTIVPGLDGHDLRRLVLNDATISVFDVDLSARQETDVRVHTELGTDNRFHVDRPSESRRVDHPLDAGVTGASDFQPHVADVASFCSGHCSQERI